ncbi:MAG: hypothetical protein OXI30_09780 [Chloroflexota bacterium]|nr:hypothetical protein [Chloroflexota bacterium]
MKRGLLLFTGLIAVLALVACSADINLLDETKLSDTSLISGEPCLAPCWNGITPGETSFQDAKLIIESDDRFAISDEPAPEDGSNLRSFTFAEGENPACCQLVSRDRETVSSFLLQTAPIMNFGAVYDVYGEPDYLGGEQVNDEQGYMALVYSELPLILYAFVDKPASGAISVSSPIIGTMYLSEADMQELLTCASLYQWQGFLDFTSYVEREFDYIGEGVGDDEVCPTGQ